MRIARVKKAASIKQSREEGRSSISMRSMSGIYSRGREMMIQHLGLGQRWDHMNMALDLPLPLEPGPANSAPRFDQGMGWSA